MLRTIGSKNIVIYKYSIPIPARLFVPFIYLYENLYIIKNIFLIKNANAKIYTLYTGV